MADEIDKVLLLLHYLDARKTLLGYVNDRMTLLWRTYGQTHAKIDVFGSNFLEIIYLYK